MLLSVVTVAFRNYDGVVNTWRSLRNLARDPSLTFEWIVVDGGSDDGTAQFLEKLNGEFNLRFVSEKDRGIYDAMNKGIAMAQGRYTLSSIPAMCFMKMSPILSVNWGEKMMTRCTLATRCWILVKEIKPDEAPNMAGISTTAYPPAIRLFSSRPQG